MLSDAVLSDEQMLNVLQKHYVNYQQQLKADGWVMGVARSVERAIISALRAQVAELATLRNDAKLCADIVAVLQTVVGDSGVSEGAVEVAERLIRERAELRDQLTRLHAAGMPTNIDSAVVWIDRLVAKCFDSDAIAAENETLRAQLAQREIHIARLESLRETPRAE